MARREVKTSASAVYLNHCWTVFAAHRGFVIVDRSFSYILCHILLCVHIPSK